MVVWDTGKKNPSLLDIIIILVERDDHVCTDPEHLLYPTSATKGRGPVLYGTKVPMPL